MQQLFDSLITPMKKVIVKDLITSYITNELENQIEIAKKLGYKSEWINDNIIFNIFSKRLRMPNASEMPCVYLFFDKTEYKTNSAFPDENRANAQLVVEMYTAGKNLLDEHQHHIISDADARADSRLEYLASQIYQILCSEQAESFRNQIGILEFFPVSLVKIAAPKRENTTESIMGEKWVFEMFFDEPTMQLSGTELKELYLSTQVKEEDIDPFVRISLKEENGGSKIDKS